MDLYKSVIIDCIVHDIHVCLKNNAPTAAILLTYSAIDAMSYLSMPLHKYDKKKKLYIDKHDVERDDFIAWVEKYMKTDEKQPYQYQGIDLYGARCSVVHNYGVESKLSRNKKCKIFAYAANSLKHFYDPAKHTEMVVLGVELFIRDFCDAVAKFLADIATDSKLQQQVESRLPKLFTIRKADNRTSGNTEQKLNERGHR